MCVMIYCAQLQTKCFAYWISIPTSSQTEKLMDLFVATTHYYCYNMRLSLDPVICFV